MAHKSNNAEIPRRFFGYSLQPTNWILEPGATCPTTPAISDFIPESLAETYKYIEVTDGHFVMAKK